MPEVALPVQPELAWAAGEFREAGMDEPRREGARIWAGLAGTPPGAVALGREVTAPPARVDAFRDAVRRRIGGEPLAKRRGLNLKATLEHQTAITMAGSRYERLRTLHVPTLVESRQLIDPI